MFRSEIMRLSCMGQDSADIQETTKCLSQRAQDLDECEVGELRRARSLTRMPRAVLIFPVEKTGGTRCVG